MGYHCGRDGGDGPLKNFEAEKSHFFKIILDEILNDGKLDIPKKFVKSYGTDIPNPVILKVPDGVEWQVELIKRDGKIWLEKGWREFEEYYSLKYGDLIVFKYKKYSHFNVVIFDMSATEIAYPSSMINATKEFNPGGRFQRPKSEETENDSQNLPASKKRREKSPLLSPQHKKMRKTNSPTKSRTTSKLHSSVPPTSKTSNPHFTKLEAKRGCKGMSGKSDSLNGTGSMQHMACSGKASALHKTSIAFKSKYPSFKVVLKPSHVRPGYQVGVPARFFKKYFNLGRFDIILCVSDGRSWSAKCFCRIQSTTMIYSGWKQFVKDNHLEVSDNCIFELIKRTEVTLKVTIYRTHAEANCRPLHRGGPKAGEFKRDLMPKLETNCATEDEARHFSLDSQYADEECNNKPLPQRKCASKQFTCDQRHSCPKIPQAPEAANNSFEVVIKPWNLKHANWYVQKKFARENMKGRTTVMLKVGNRLWPVKLNRYDRCPDEVYLSLGWCQLKSEVSLEVGDICMFEMIEKDPELVLNVTVSKHAG